MMTWQIMIGAQMISILISAGVVVSFMRKKEPLDAARKEGIAPTGHASATTV